MKALVVVMMGGIGNMVGSLLAGILLGVAEALCSYLVDSGLTLAVAYFLFLIVLLVRPRGPVRDPMTTGSKIAAVALAMLVALLAAVPWLVSDYGLGFMVNLMCYLVLTIAWTLFSGTTRYVSLATAAFFGLGAYTVAMLVKEMPIYATFGIALVLGTVMALLVGLVTLAHLRHVLRGLRLRVVGADARSPDLVGDQPDQDARALRLCAVRHDADLLAPARSRGAGVPGRLAAAAHAARHRAAGDRRRRDHGAPGRHQRAARESRDLRRVLGVHDGGRAR
jgi:hypothetical protein